MKTIAIRLEDDLHARLTAIAQLEGSTVTDIIREGIQSQLDAKRSQPELAARAEEALAEIDAEAASRREAIATLFGTDEPTEEAATTDAPAKPAGRTRKGAAKAT